MAQQKPGQNRGRRALVVFLLMVAMAGRVIAQTATSSELLQRGIYLQETVGDLDGAIKIYRQIITLAQQSRVVAAQAEYRLAVCLQKKGQNAEAATTFQKLIRDYPEQAGIAANARQSLSREDCVSFSPVTAAAMMVNGSWQIMDGLHRMFIFGDQESDARRALEIIKHYNMDQLCSVSHSRTPFRYLLVSGASPVGSLPGEDCDSFDPVKVAVTKDGESWKISDGNTRMFDFGGNRLAANQALAMIKLHGFDESCFVDRQRASFMYMKAPGSPSSAAAENDKIDKPENSSSPDASAATWKLLPTQWTDGEVLEYTTTRKNSRLYKSWYSLHESKTRPNRWSMDERIPGYCAASAPCGFPGSYYRLEFDAGSMKPIESLETTTSLRVQVTYRAHLAQIIENEGRRLAQVVLSGPVFDQKELPFILSRLPWTDGYQARISMLSPSNSDRVFSYEFAMTGEENVETPAGSFHCYQIEKYLANGSSASEKYWVSTDSAHLVIKRQSDDTVEELSALPGTAPEESVYSSDKIGYTFTVPAGWMLKESSAGNPDLYDLNALATVSLVLCPCTSNAGTPEGLRMEAEKQAKNQEEKNLKVRPQSWQTRHVGGRDAVSWIADTDSSTVIYRVMVMTELPTSVLIIRISADQKSFDTLRPRFDAIIDSMKLN
jgi:tetratricopeptide (TPR) repeat protein